MHSTYAQTQKTAQKKEASTAAAVLDASSQNEGLQRKADMANGAAQREEAPRPNNTGMPDNLKSGIESLSGFSMDDVRVHYNSSKPATVQALAYTQGTDIHVAPGQEKHLPHEAWHVAQQMAGRVSPTTNINGMPVNDNAALEHEADVMGAKAVQCKHCKGNAIVDKRRESNVVQCGGKYNKNSYLAGDELCWHIHPNGITKKNLKKFHIKKKGDEKCLYAKFDQSDTLNDVIDRIKSNFRETFPDATDEVIMANILKNDKKKTWVNCCEWISKKMKKS